MKPTHRKTLSSLAVAGTLIAAVTAAVPVSAAPDVPSGVYGLDPTHASVTWKVNHLGLSNYTARFTRLDASIDYNAAAPADSRVSVTIDPASLETDYPFADQTDFDAELRGPQFFNTAEYGAITFTSTRLQLTGETTGKLHGDLTLLGQTRPVVLDVTLNGSMAEHPYAKKAALGFSAQTVVKRSDFGMTHLVPYIGDDVTVLIEAEFIAR